MSETKPPEEAARNPYVGPRPFETRDQGLFFGRDWEAEELVALVVAHPAVLLYAQSGAGKSSLLNARVIPQLRTRESCEVLPVARVRGDIPAGIHPRQIENLYAFNALLSWTEETDIPPEQLINLSLTEFLQTLPHQSDNEGYPALRIVIIDQFEELFTFYPQRWPEREKFFDQVNQALADDSLLRVLFVVREDFLAQLDPYLPVLPEHLRYRFRLERLRREAALAAVVGPLAGSGRSFAPGVAEALVAELLKIRVEGRAGGAVEAVGEFVEPVQLQVVCQSLWNDLPPDVSEITEKQLLAFGNVDQALTRFYDEALKHAIQQTRLASRSTRAGTQPDPKPPATIPYQGVIRSWLDFVGEKLFWEGPLQEPVILEWRLRNWFEREFITPAGTRGLVYRGTKATSGVPNIAVEILENRHLIRAEQRAGARWYELTHDRFVSPIQTSNAKWQMTKLRQLGALGAALMSLILATLIIIVLVKNQSAQTAAANAAAIAEAAQQVEKTATAALDQATRTAGEVNATSTAAAQTIRKDPVRPLRPGLSIGMAGTDRLGTLGYFVVDRAGRVYLLGTVNSLDPAFSQSGVLQPASADGGQPPGDVVANEVKILSQSASMPATHLVALARLTSTIQYQTLIPQVGPVRGARAPRPGMQVHTLGRTTGYAEGQIRDLNYSGLIATAQGMIQIREAVRTDLKYSVGDEGSLVVDDEGYAVGVVVAATNEGTFLAPLPETLQSFDVRLLMPPFAESPYLYGLYDRGGEQLMLDERGRAKGWVLVSKAIGAGPPDTNISDYTDLAYQGFGVIVQLNYTYGLSGTLPLSQDYDSFAQRVADFVANSSGANIWVIGNEMNSERNWPRQPGSSQGERITPRLYADCYQKVRQAIRALPGHENDQVLIGPIAPWNAELSYEADPNGVYPANQIDGGAAQYPYASFYGDWVTYLHDILVAIGPGQVDGIAIHAYTHGYDPALVFSDATMDAPFENRRYQFRTYQDQMNAIPPEFRALPVYLTETHGSRSPDGSTWPQADTGWVKNVYQEINNWNNTPGSQPIRAVVLYRWSTADDWGFKDNIGLQQDFREAVAQDYRWKPE